MQKVRPGNFSRADFSEGIEKPIHSARSEEEKTVKKPKPATSTRPAETAVALPASTGTGIVHEPAASDILNAGEHQNNDIPGDRAAAEVTRPVLAIGAVVEPVNPALASEPAITGDAAGDAAIAAAGAGPEILQPLAIDISSSQPDTFEQSAFLVDPEINAGFSDPATFSPDDAVVTGIDLAGGPDQHVEYVVFDLTRPPTEEERRNLQLVLDHIEGSLPDPRVPAVSTEQIMRNVDSFSFAQEFPRTADLLGDWRVTEDHDHPVLRVTAKVAGFRRGGIAHPAEPVDHPVGSLKPHQIEAMLAEPQLVVELI